MDKTLLKAVTVMAVSILFDKWWSVIFTTSKYLVLPAVVKACIDLCWSAGRVIVQDDEYY